MNAPKPLQIFRPGRHTASNGVTLDFSESDLQAMVAAYDPAKYEAPLVVGHPKTDAPAYGWVKSLTLSGGVLSALPGQVDPVFSEMVTAGRFKKISAAIYTPNSPGNPAPGGYYLKHVGFLGAAAPAVKGLRDAEFAEDEEGVFEFADWGDIQNATLWRRMRDWLIGEKGLATADSILPDYAVSSLEDEARKEPDDSGAAATPVPAFSEQSIHQETVVTPEQKAALEAENAQLKKDLADATARDKAAQATARHTAHASFAEGLVKEGKLLPVHASVAVATMDFMAAQTDVVEFGEGDEKKPLIDAFKTFLTSQPKVVDFKEHAGGKGPEDEEKDASAISAKAVEFQEVEAKAGRIVNIAQAVAHVTAKAAK